MKNICNCGMCTQEYQHLSDCAVHNEPALPNGDCNCKAHAVTEEEQKYSQNDIIKAMLNLGYSFIDREEFIETINKNNKT